MPLKKRSLQRQEQAKQPRSDQSSYPQDAFAVSSELSRLERFVQLHDSPRKRIRSSAKASHVVTFIEKVSSDLLRTTLTKRRLGYTFESGTEGRFKIPITGLHAQYLSTKAPAAASYRK